MSGNASKLGTKFASAHPGAAVEMAAYDELPPELRQAIREAPIVVGAAAAKRAIALFGAKRAAQMLRDSLQAQMPQIVAAAWGPDHPQAKR